MTGQCLGNNGVDPSTAFRIGKDGYSAPLPSVSATLPQPYFPGVGGNAGASDVTFLDPKYRPELTDNVTITLQRQVSNSMILEAGYVGRRIRNELSALNLDSVPYMTTLGGQSFSAAFAQAYFATPASGTLNSSFSATAQPFFETALGGAGSAYCAGYANCTSAVIAKNATAIRNTAVSDLWTALYKSPSWILPRSMISQPIGTGISQGYTYIANASNGYGNYNALFVTYRLRDWHGISATSNFTWGRALGTGTTSQATSSNTWLDVFNPQNNYGPQSYDIRFLYNVGLFYIPKWYKSQHGVVGRLVGGWTFSPLLVAQSGSPFSPTYIEAGSSTGQQAFGEVSTASSATSSFLTNLQGTGPLVGADTSSAHYNVSGSNGIGTNNPAGVNLFADPAAVLNQLRRCILGYDQNCSSYVMRGLPRWNLDLSVGKTLNVTERIGADLSFQFTNVLNHPQMADPGVPTGSAADRRLTTPSQFGRMIDTISTARQMEFGLRIHF
jgi:hypothetical protein